MSDGATQPEGRAQGHPDENQREVGAIQGEPGAEAHPSDATQSEARAEVHADGTPEIEAAAVVQPQPSRLVLSVNEAERWVRWLPIGAIFVYGVGFVVSTLFYAGLALPSQELLQTRFVSAGLLFTLAFLLPAIGVSVLFVQAWTRLGHVLRGIWIWVRRRPLPEDWDPNIARAFAIILATMYLVFEGWVRLVGYLTNDSALLRSMYGGHPPEGLFYVFWGAVLALVFAHWIAMTRSHPYIESLASHNLTQAVTALRTAFVAPVLLVGMAPFATEVYPFVTPAFGGASTAVVRIKLTPGGRCALAEAFSQECHLWSDCQSAGLIERGTKLVTLAVCNKKTFRVVSLAEFEILAIESRRQFVPLPRLQSRCIESVRWY